MGLERDNGDILLIDTCYSSARGFGRSLEVDEGVTLTNLTTASGSGSFNRSQETDL
jgi:hypothetical protein